MNLQAVMEYINAGGTFVIWVLFVCSILLIAVLGERLYMMAGYNVNGDWLLKQTGIFVANDRLEDAVEFCKGKRWLLAEIFSTGLHRYHCSRDDIADAMNTQLSASQRKLDANLSILGTIAVIAPFVGLFGTVLGIIQAFNDIAKHGKTGIETVGAGVAVALVTTAGGLLVAILAVVAFNYFKARSKRMVGELSDQSSRLLELLTLKKSGVKFPDDLGIPNARPSKS